MLFAPSGKGRKRQKKGEKGRFRPISRKGGQTPLKPPFVRPPFVAAQLRSIHNKQVAKHVTISISTALLGGITHWWKLQHSSPKQTLYFQRFQKGVGGRGLATTKPPRRAQKVLQKCVPLLLRGALEKGYRKRPESLAHEEFPRANPLCPPTPFRNL